MKVESVYLFVLLFGYISAANQWEVKAFYQTFPVPNPDYVATLTVEPGWRILGGGASVTDMLNPTTSHNLLVSSYPLTHTQWVAEGRKGYTPSNANMSIAVIAIWDPKNLLDYQIFTRNGTVASHPNATVNIPAGYVMTGGGARIMPLSGLNGAGNFLVSTYPMTNDSWYVEGKDHITVDMAQITGFAIGIKSNDIRFKMENAIYYSPTSSPSTNPTVQVVVPHYPDQYITGGGALLRYGTGMGNMLWETRPLYRPDGIVGWTSSAQQQSYSSNCVLTSAAVVVTLDY